MHSNRKKLLWLQGVTCNGNSHSFLNHPNLFEILKKIEILYHPILKSTYELCDIINIDYDFDILIFEGCFDTKIKRGGFFINDIFNHLQDKASRIIALGSCASYGGLLKEANPNTSSGIAFDKDKEIDFILKDKSKLINIPGCPIHPEWLGYVLEMIFNQKDILLDEEYRPVELFSYLAHHGCDRNEYFEWKIDSKNFGEKEGCLFYEQGCKGPLTHSPCNKILWNEINSKTRAGTPCFGCTQRDFPKTNLYKTKTNMSIPQDVPIGVPKRAYLTLTGIAKTFHIKRLEGKLIDYKKNYRKD